MTNASWIRLFLVSKEEKETYCFTCAYTFVSTCKGKACFVARICVRPVRREVRLQAWVLIGMIYCDLLPFSPKNLLLFNVKLKIKTALSLSFYSAAKEKDFMDFVNKRDGENLFKVSC